MAAISLIERDDSPLHQLVRRKNWAAENAGVMLVFCIVFVIASGLLSLYLYRKWMAKKAARASVV
jgi:hypothetical protein